MAVTPKNIANNVRGFDYPKGKMFHFGFAFYNMKQIKKKMQNYCKPYVNGLLFFSLLAGCKNKFGGYVTYTYL